jgi:uncharacterized membrane protein YoaK (UPF0700 family)
MPRAAGKAKLRTMHARKEVVLGPATTMSLLAFVSGFVDTLSFVGLFGLFAAHITGNFVMMATSIAEFRHGLWIKLLAVPIFILFAVLTRIFIIRRERNELQATAHVLGVQAVLLSIFMVVALWASPLSHHETPAVIAAAAIAIQNTAARTFLAGLPPTTVMTGNLIQVIVDMVDIWNHHGAIDAKRKRLSRLLPMLLCFIVGSILAAVGYLVAGFWSLILPIVIVTGLSLSVRPHLAPA